MTHHFRLLLFVLAGLACAPATLLGSDEAEGWTWTEKQEKQLRKLERKVRDANGLYIMEEQGWKVITFGSARLAAEIRLYVDLLEAEVLDRLGSKRQYIEEPTFRLFPTRKEFQDKVAHREGAAYCFESVVDPKGKSQFRVRVLRNHLFTYLEDNESPTLTDLKLSYIRREVVKAVFNGMTGRPEFVAWLEQGLMTYFESWDLQASGAEALEIRRTRSPGIAELRKHFSGDNVKWMPPLDKVLKLDSHMWDATPVTSLVENDVLAESIVDLLLSDKKAKSLRQKIVKEAVRAGLKGSGTVVLSKTDVKKLQFLWHRHLRSL